jgi:hypothetical protein
VDGKPSTLADRQQARLLAETAGIEPVGAVHTLIDETVTAVLIDSTLLGAPIWFALRDDWQPDQGDTTPVFYASELPYLRGKTPKQLRSIFNVKAGFDGGMVRQ